MLQTGMNSLVLSGLNLAIICVAKKNLAIIKVVLTGSACMLFMLVHRRQAYYLPILKERRHMPTCRTERKEIILPLKSLHSWWRRDAEAELRHQHVTRAAGPMEASCV